MDIYSNGKSMNGVLDGISKQLQNHDLTFKRSMEEECRIFGTMLGAMRMINPEDEIYKATQAMVVFALPVMLRTAFEALTEEDIPTMSPYEFYSSILIWSNHVQHGRDKDELSSIINGKLWYNATWSLLAILLLDMKDKDNFIIQLLEEVALIDFYINGLVWCDKEEGVDDIKCNYPAMNV